MVNPLTTKGVSQPIVLRENKLSQSLMTDHFEIILRIRSIGTITYSEYKRIQLQNYLKTIISDTFSEVFGPWLISQGQLLKLF